MNATPSSRKTPFSRTAISLGGLLLLTGIAVAVAYRSNPIGSASQQMTMGSEQKKIGKENIADFLAVAPDSSLIVDGTFDGDNPNSLYLDMQHSWDKLVAAQQKAKMQTWVRVWKQITVKRPAGPGQIEVAFFKVDGKLQAVFKEKRSG